MDFGNNPTDIVGNFDNLLRLSSLLPCRACMCAWKSPL